MVQYHEVKINLDFESMANVMSVPVSGATIDATLWVDYIFLDTDERRRFAQLSHEYLIEQLQFTGDEGINNATPRIKLNYNHPVKELIWVIARDGATDWTDYTDGTGADAGNNVTEAKLQLNGQDRFATRFGDYFNLVQPFQHHENVPSNRGINVYSFALKPEEHQPSGTLNFSRIDTAVLQLKVSDAAAAGSTIRSYATNFNVLRIMSGINLTCAQQSAANLDVASPYWINSVNATTSTTLYNWLVRRGSYQSLRSQQTQIVGKLLRVWTTTRHRKQWMRTSGNDRRYSNNVQNWIIRSQASAVRMTTNMMKVQRADGFGDESFVKLYDSLRCAPYICESIYNCSSGWARIQQLNTKSTLFLIRQL
jgi:hypothetical protein